MTILLSKDEKEEPQLEAYENFEFNFVGANSYGIQLLLMHKTVLTFAVFHSRKRKTFPYKRLLGAIQTIKCFSVALSYNFILE